MLMNTVLGLIQNKVKTKILTVTSTTSHIVHNLIYIPANDELQVFYKGVLLDRGINYNDNNDHLSIDLIDWTISSGEDVKFVLYRNVK